MCGKQRVLRTGAIPAVGVGSRERKAGRDLSSPLVWGWLDLVGQEELKEIGGGVSF